MQARTSHVLYAAKLQANALLADLRNPTPQDAHLLRDIASGTRTPHARQAADDFARGLTNARQWREHEMDERDQADESLRDAEEQAADDRRGADLAAWFGVAVSYWPLWLLIGGVGIACLVKLCR
jgi:N-acyl-D-aspartate/D-glutamate deacylase